MTGNERTETGSRSKARLRSLRMRRGFQRRAGRRGGWRRGGGKAAVGGDAEHLREYRWVKEADAFGKRRWGAHRRSFLVALPGRPCSIPAPPLTTLSTPHRPTCAITTVVGRRSPRPPRLLPLDAGPVLAAHHQALADVDGSGTDYCLRLIRDIDARRPLCQSALISPDTPPVVPGYGNSHEAANNCKFRLPVCCQQRLHD
ncbi:hypothetical protein CC80DRAFT_156209 [Byssothecium circinans]|uniref:Uncharacterized protein n=1 Tax=Byssothecium circinans TaxID=147558 RepID=A0A6A5UM68_9PLEO|nr:hypothetical protein CC80DRAFT_156209 [Byssothecium circinans]